MGTKVALSESVKIQDNTLQMKKEFVRLHRKGMTVKEIAERFDLSTWTVYHYLGEIAEENGLTREELLSKPKKPAVKNATAYLVEEIDYCIPGGIIIEVKRRKSTSDEIKLLSSYAKDTDKSLSDLDKKVLASIKELEKISN